MGSPQRRTSDQPSRVAIVANARTALAGGHPYRLREFPYSRCRGDLTSTVHACSCSRGLAHTSSLRQRTEEQRFDQMVGSAPLANQGCRRWPKRWYRVAAAARSGCGSWCASAGENSARSARSSAPVAPASPASSSASGFGRSTTRSVLCGRRNGTADCTRWPQQPPCRPHQTRQLLGFHCQMNVRNVKTSAAGHVELNDMFPSQQPLF